MPAPRDRPSIVPVTRHGIGHGQGHHRVDSCPRRPQRRSSDRPCNYAMSRPTLLDLHVSQFGRSAVFPSRPAISESAGRHGGQGKRVAARSHAQPPLCGEHGEHRRALDLEGRGDRRNHRSGWVRPNFRFPQSLERVGKRKREAIKKRDGNAINFRDPAQNPAAAWLARRWTWPPAREPQTRR